MSTWSGKLHAITTRSECSVSDSVHAWSIEAQERIDLRGPTSLRQKMTHTTQISFTLFTHSPYKKYRAVDQNPLGLDCLRECDQGRETAAVVGNSRGIQSVIASHNREVCFFWKDGVEMSTEDDQRR